MIDNTGFFLGLGGIIIDDIKSLNSLPKNTNSIHTSGLGENELKLLSDFQKLQKLEVSNKVFPGNSIGDEIFNSLQNLTQIEELALTNITITGKGISKLSKLPKIKSLYIKFTRFEDQMVEELAGLTKLENLYLELDEPINLDALGSLINLRYLAIKMSPTKISFAKVYPKLQKLESLSLTIQDFLNDKQLENIHYCQKLKNLSLHRADKLSNKSIVEIGQLKNLVYLNIYGYKITEEDINHISKLKYLKETSFHVHSNIGKSLNKLAEIKGLTCLNLSSQKKLTDESFTAFYNHPNLKEVRLLSSKITENTIRVIASLAKLEILDISQCEKIDDNAMTHLSSCFKLQNLGISYCNISDQTLKVISKLKNIEVLELDGIEGFTNQGITAISKLTELKHLSFAFCQLEDSKIISLSNLSKLLKLNLDGNKLTDRSIGTFLRLANLQVLGVDCSEITETGYLKLIKHPKITYIYGNGDYVTRNVWDAFEKSNIGIDTRHGMD